MIREERAKAYAEDMVRNAYWSDIEFQSDATLAVCDFAQAYLQGAREADAHLVWRMCEDELPPLEKESERYSQDVIIAVQIGNEYEYGFSYYDYHNEYWIGSVPETFIPNVVAWLPLPKFNPKAEKE